VRIGALVSALSLLVKEGRMTVVENIELAEIKTKTLEGVLDTLKAGNKTLVVDGKDNENLRLSIRNMKRSNFLPPEGVNVYDVLRHDHVVVSKDAAKALEARLLEQES
jgi:large subunit ribosomal protein L4